MDTNNTVLTDAQIEKGWHDTFSTSNPYCPCNLKSFTKAVRWAEHALSARIQPAASEAESLPEGWKLTKKATCYTLTCGNDHIANLVGPEAAENAAKIARMLAASEADHDEMERRGWVNVGYKHDVEKARCALSHCDIPGFDQGMSLDNAIYELRRQRDEASEAGAVPRRIPISQEQFVKWAMDALQTIGWGNDSLAHQGREMLEMMRSVAPAAPPSAPAAEPNYEALYEQMCERCDILDAKLSEYEAAAESAEPATDAHVLNHEDVWHLERITDASPEEIRLIEQRVMSKVPVTPAQEWLDAMDEILDGKRNGWEFRHAVMNHARKRVMPTAATADAQGDEREFK